GFDGARFAAESHRAEAEDGYFADVFSNIEDQVAETPELAPLSDPARFSWTQVTVGGGRYAAQSEVAYREDLCRHLTVTEGDCDTGDGEVLISKRSAELEDVEPGDTLTIGTRKNPDAKTAEVTIAGVYEPHNASDGYWGRNSPFDHSTSADALSLDSLFMTDPQSTATVERPVEIGVDYTIAVSEVRLANAPRIGAKIKELDAKGSIGSHELKVESKFSSTLESVKAEQDSVSASVPLVTVPLVLLSWFVLYLVVARLSEERGPQIALAKLRGHRFRSVTGFGAGEAAVLIAVGAPLGALLGWALVEALALLTLAQGASATFTAGIAVYAGASLLGALAAALAASRPVLTRPVLALLRRVPARAGWRAGITEGALVALAAVAVWQVLSTSEAGPIGLLATPLLALVVGVVVARALELLARRRLPTAVRKAKVARMLALAQVSRRPETRRMVILVTVAAAVMTFGVCSWGVSQYNRDLTASDELGADRVYTLSGGSPNSIMETVEELDPAGTELMAVMRRVDRFNNLDFTTVAVQSDRLANVAQWRDLPPERLRGIAADLHPKRPAPLRVEGDVSVKATVTDFEAGKVPSLVARVVGDDGNPVVMRLGKLTKGEKTYKSSSPDCENGCRLIGVGVSSFPGDFEEISAELNVTSVSDEDGVVDAALGDCDRWHPAADLPDTDTLKLDCSTGLSLSVTKQNSNDFIASYASAPVSLPVALAGRMPSTQVSGAEFTAMGPQRELQKYLRTEKVDVVPRGGARSMMVDLDYTNQSAQNFTALHGQEELSFEIWASPSAGSDVADRLAKAGLVVTRTESRDELLERLAHAAPALSLQLYLLAGGLALLLVVGAVLLSSTVGAAVRGYDVAALTVAGVAPRVLRSASIREHLYWIVFPALAGIGSGVAGLALVLPSVPLVTSEPPEVATRYALQPLLPGAGLLIMAAAFAVVVWSGVRVALRRGTPGRLRDSDS
ncbi:MAG: hypothetical protein ACRD0P_08220, partial [Stackebrandtia sp.]